MNLKSLFKVATKRFQFFGGSVIERQLLVWRAGFQSSNNPRTTFREIVIRKRIFSSIGLLVSIVTLQTSLNVVHAAAVVVDDGTNSFRSVASNIPTSGNVWSSLAQSFTAEDVNISFGFKMFDRPHQVGNSIVYNLYSGENSYSTLLATRTVSFPTSIAPPNNFDFSNFGFLDADFSAVALSIGSKYTVQITMPGGILPALGTDAGMKVFTSNNNPYNNGRFFFPPGPSAYDNSFFSQQDMLFRATPALPVILNTGRDPFINPVSSSWGFGSTMDAVIEGGAFVFKTIIDYVGLGITQSRLDNYENGIEKFWSAGRVVKLDGHEYNIKFDVQFRDANNGFSPNSNVQIFINNNVCRSDARNWCLNQQNEPVTQNQQEHLAAHEFGHLSIGLIDEYDDTLIAGTPYGAQVGYFDRFNNICKYQTVRDPHSGDWCEDMMAFGLDTSPARYWSEIETYLVGNSNRPDMQFGQAPLIPGIFDVPVERLPSDDHPASNSVPEPSTLVLLIPALMLLRSKFQFGNGL